jgi:hypothetical protein
VLYSTVGVVRYVNLRRIPVAVSGRVIYPICSQALPDLRAKLIINTQARKLKFLESLVAMREQPAASSTKVIGLALEFTVQQPPEQDIAPSQSTRVAYPVVFLVW